MRPPVLSPQSFGSCSKETPAAAPDIPPQTHLAPVPPVRGVREAVRKAAAPAAVNYKQLQLPMKLTMNDKCWEACELTEMDRSIYLLS